MAITASAVFATLTTLFFYQPWNSEAQQVKTTPLDNDAYYVGPYMINWSQQRTSIDS